MSTLATQCSSTSGSGTVLLLTAVTAFPSSSGPISARILFDTGSQHSYITSTMADRLSVPRVREEVLTLSTFGTTRIHDAKTPVASLSVPVRDGPNVHLEAYVVPHIVNSITRDPLASADKASLADYPATDFADSHLSLDRPATVNVDILVGLDHFWDFILSSRAVLPSGLRILESRLGLIIAGRSQSPATENTVSPRRVTATALFVSAVANRMAAMPTSAEGDVSAGLQRDIADLWQLDSIGISDSPDVCEDDLALAHFQQTVRFDGSRYEVSWPWKEPRPDLATNYGLAMGRMRSLTRRFQSDPSLLSRYAKVIADQERLGIVEKVTENTVISTVKHYLPHQPVLTPGKSTTKLRVVYDASARSSRSASSLNQCLLRGPVRLPSLCGVLLRFRLHNVAVCADVEKAFLQISIRPDDRDVTRFLWFKNPTAADSLVASPQTLDTYRFCRVPFGLICSPFLLEATIRHHLQSSSSSLAPTLIDNTYVDNVLLGAASTLKLSTCTVSLKPYSPRHP